MYELFELVKSLKEVPAMPNVIVHALNVLKNPISSAKQLGNVISYDQALSTKVLTLVNSAYYGFPQQIASISRAITLLGMTKTKNIVITVAMRPMLQNRGDKEMWEHSIKVGVACEYLSQRLNLMDSDDAFVVGFLHDLGKIVLTIKDKILYNQVKVRVSNGENILEVEKQLYGADHTQMGSLLAKNWQLPLLITNSIKYHHMPEKSSMLVPCSLVHLADMLVQDSWTDDMLDANLTKYLNIRAEQVLALRDNILNRANILLKDLST